MKKTEKVEYIDEVLKRIGEAPNHGNNGNSWWYPTPYTIAYNVKLYEWLDIDELRKKMSKLQNDYYNDEVLNDIGYYNYLNMEREALIEDIKMIDDTLEVIFSGRSGGWCEVTYNSIDEDITMDSHMDDVDDVYNSAKELNNLESEVAQLVEKRIHNLKKYMKSEEYLNDVLEQLQDDNEIKDTYTTQANILLDKCK